MDEVKRKKVQNWLKKAKLDLVSARKLASGPNTLLDPAMFFCQQAAEKSIKAALVFHDHRFKKVHDIRELLLLAVPYQRELAPWVEKASFLTAYVSEFRYPEEETELEQEDFERALAVADQLYNFVLSLLPKEVHPSIA